MGVLRQCLFAFIACYVSLIMGLMYAWPSSTFKLFNSTNTTLHRPMSELELALFGSLSSVGAVVCTPIAGYFMDVIGRKHCTVACCIAQMISWALVVVSYRVEAVLAAIFLSGAGGATFLIIPVYVGEFSQDSIRGGLMSLAIVFYAIGMLISYLFGGYLEYHMMSYVCLTMTVSGVILISFLKESPVYLMKKKREEEAIQAISFFRGISRESKEMMQELNSIQRALNPDLDPVDSPEEENLKPQVPVSYNEQKLTTWQFIKKSRSTQRAMFIVIILMTLSVNQGLAVMQVYAEPLFEEVVPNMSATIGSVLLAVMTVVAGFVAAYLVDTMGRRNLMIWASILAGICNVTIATQVQLHWAPHWFTAVSVYMFGIASSAGAGTVPYVLLGEVFLPEVRSLMSMLMVEWAWLCNFIVLFIFNPTVSALGLWAVFYMFAIVCFASSVFTYFYLPETMGMPVDVIQLLFVKKLAQNARRRC